MKKISLYTFLILVCCNSGFAGILDQKKYVCKDEMGYDWGQVQGAGYWCYQGKTLRDLVSEK